MERITIIGKGRAGTSLAKAIRIANRANPSSFAKLSAHISARQEKYPSIDSEIIIITSKDDEIASVSKAAMSASSDKLRLVVHLAGSLPSTILALREGVSRLTLHPIQTFPKANADLLQGIYWMASSDDAKAIRWARRFTANLGGKGVIVLDSDMLPLYHAMTVFASNFITILFSAIEEIAAALGQDPKRMKAALRPLAEKSLENALSKPAESVLSGPIARKDFATIRKHQKTLKALDPRMNAIYKAFLDYGVTMGTSKR